jgi:hypothetical protein
MKYLAYPLVVAILYVAFAMGNQQWDPMAWHSDAAMAHALSQVGGLAMVYFTQLIMRDVK